MRLTAELSLYPFREEYKEVVLHFLEELMNEEEVIMATNSMSTQLSGEDEKVFAAVQLALRASHKKFGAQVLVAKFVPEHFGDIGPNS